MSTPSANRRPTETEASLLRAPTTGASAEMIRANVRTHLGSYMPEGSSISDGRIIQTMGVSTPPVSPIHGDGMMPMPMSVRMPMGMKMGMQMGM
jgi:hypothetical protein